MGEEIVSMLGTRGNADGDADESRIQAELTQTPISLTNIASELDASSPESLQQPCLLPASFLSEGLL